MNITITGTTLDYILIGVFILSIMMGWKNGLVDTLIRFISTIFVLGISWFFSKPIATLIPLPELAIDYEIMVFIAPFIQRAIAFVGLLIILSIAKTIIYMLIRPMIMKLIEFIKIVDVVDSIFGVIFNVAKDVIIASFVLAALNLPIFTNGQQVLQESKAANIILMVSPTLSDQLMEFGEGIVDFTQVEQWANRDFNAKDMIYLLDAMNAFEVLNEEGLTAFYNQYAYQISILPNAIVSEQEYQELYEKVEAIPASEAFKTTLMNKVSY